MPPLLPILADYMLPQGGSNLTDDVQRTWLLVLFVTGFFFCIVVGVMTFFVIRYRRRTPHDVTSQVTHNTRLEILWTGIPLLLVIAFFYIGFKGFLNYDTPRSDCVVIDVEASKWKFSFTYPNGAQATNILYLLKDQPVRLNMHSVDVLHALYLPNFGTQRNLIPGRLTTLWFIPTELTPRTVKTNPATGQPELVADEGWPFYCTQYCGDGHSRMFGRVYVLEKADYDRKMLELANPFKRKDGAKTVFVPYVELGGTLAKQIGCTSCHSVDAAESLGTGPPWHGLWKRDHEPFAASNVPGYTLMASDLDPKWEAYLKESILDPDAKLVRYKGVNYRGMSTFASQLSGNTTNDEKLWALMDYIKSLGNTSWKPDVTPKDNPDLFDADNPKLVDAQGVGIHPESQAGIAARKKLSLAPATPTPPAQSQPGN